MINISRIRPTYEGQYLLPSLTYGWNDELIKALKESSAMPKPLVQYFDYWGIQLSKSGVKVLGIGDSVEKAVADATRELHYEFKHLMPGQFANFPAYKWTYLQPDYLVLEQITMPDNSNICLILQRG